MQRRDIQLMPDFVKQALIENDVYNDYLARPHYQRNDYLMWITNAKQEKTKKKRVQQMIDELRVGGIYMNMDHPASSKH